MTDQTPIDRRKFVRLAGSAATLALVAGCGGPGQEEGEGDPGAQTEAGPEEGAGGSGAQGGGSGEGEEGSERVEEWLSSTDNYDGVVDQTDVNRTTIQVGAPGNDGDNAFEPAAVRISPGMTVRWEWTGDGTHNVVEQDETFKSGSPTDDSDEVYEFDFEEAGTYLYYCERHEGRGMKGAVVVGEGGDAGGGGGNESDDGDEGGSDSGGSGNESDDGETESEGTGYDDDSNGSITR